MGDRSLQTLGRQVQLLETDVLGLHSLVRRVPGGSAELDLQQLLSDSLALVEPGV